MSDLVERLKPRWAIDEEVVRAAASGMIETVNKWLVQNNALKSEAATALTALEQDNAKLRETLKPFADCAAQMDRELPWARDGKVTFVHPLDGVLPKLDGMTDEQCPTWPVPDDLALVYAWRYHDPQPISESMGVQMSHFRAAHAAIGGPKI